MAGHAGRYATGPHSGESAPLSTGISATSRAWGGGVWEARVIFGPGYRIYFGKDGAQLVLLLLGGDKSNQTADVARAQESWKAYQEGKPRGKTK
jgi:putative addiction module killer protein